MISAGERKEKKKSIWCTLSAPAITTQQTTQYGHQNKKV